MGQEGGHAIVVKGLRKSYGDWPVLWDLDLAVDWAQFLVIFGGNGVGKTTLLKLLSTQARPDAGEIRIAGINPARDPSKVRRSIGVVSHNGLLYEDMTCDENLIFYSRMYGLKDIPLKVEHSLGMVGLQGRRNQRVRTLSNGMQKRLSIARAVLHEPSVLFLDEPEAGLDQEALEMLGAILADWKAGGRTAVMTTHNLEQGLIWGDRVAILSGGKIAYEEERDRIDIAGFRGTYLRYLEVGS